MEAGEIFPFVQVLVFSTWYGWLPGGDRHPLPSRKFGAKSGTESRQAYLTFVLEESLIEDGNEAN